MSEQGAPGPWPPAYGWPQGAPRPPAVSPYGSMQHYGPPPQPPPYLPPYRPPVRRASGQWYYLVPALSFGYLAWVPFLHAGGRLRRRAVWVRGGAVVGLTATGFALLGVDDIAPLGSLWLILVAVIACLMLRPLRREIYDGPPAPPPVTQDPMVAHVLHGRALRTNAREIAARDPLMARELRIGRPDLPGRTFQDGGLVDLNCATAEMLSIACGLSREHAESIVASRAQLGSFSSVDEVAVYASLTPGAADAVREYGVVLPA